MSSDRRARSDSPLNLHIRKLEDRLSETEDTLHAFSHGKIDALVVDVAGERRIYSLSGADYPYRDLVEQMQDGVIKFDELGTLFYCNRSFAEWLDVPQERIVGRTLQSFLVAGDAPHLARMLHLARQKPLRRELTLVSVDQRHMGTSNNRSFSGFVDGFGWRR